MQRKAAKVGFDWPDVSGPLQKVHEETREVEQAMQAPLGDTNPALARELGDLLFAVVNLSRHLRVDPERELRATAHRFRDRFQHVERRLAETGRRPSDATLAEMDQFWNEAKRHEATSAQGEVR